MGEKILLSTPLQLQGNPYKHFEIISDRYILLNLCKMTFTNEYS